MKLHPILFSTPMVQAILNGSKTMTRREIKMPQSFDVVDGPLIANGTTIISIKSPISSEFIGVVKCPYGKVGDVLWVRERFFQWSNGAYFYFSDEGGSLISGITGKPVRWKPSIHMPYAACRLWLEITEVRIERLNDISKADAIAEGIEPLLMSSMQLASSGQLYRDYGAKVKLFNDGVGPLTSYKWLWESINGKNSWKVNPWVWVIGFKRIDKINS